MVYIALPSPVSASTLRAGAAIAAPTAAGSAKPIEPPIAVSQSCGAAPAVGAPNERPVVIASSTTIACSGISAVITAAMPSGVGRPCGSAPGALRCATPAGGVARAPRASASASSAPCRSSCSCAIVIVSQPSGASTPGLPG